MAKCCGDDTSNEIVTDSQLGSPCIGTPNCGCNTCMTVGNCITPTAPVLCGSPTDCCTPTQNYAQPYYQAAGVCAEDNAKTTFVYGNSMVVKNSNAFAMPSCGASIAITFPGVIDVPIGGWLWAAGLGSLTIIGFNSALKQITLRNDCPQSCGGQAAPGTPIPACTIFILTKPDCGNTAQGPGTTFPYLAVSFTAPGVGDCIPITVTNVNGLSVGHNIGITTGTYRIDAITSATNITICNDGAGLPEGSVVEATDGAGNFLVPIVLIDANPCNNTAVLAGKLLVCKSGIEQPLTGSESGQVPVYDHGTGEVNFRTIALPVLDCTTLSVCLTLDPDLPAGTSYLVTVASTGDFVVGDLVTIQGTIFTVDVIIDATHMRIIPLEDPTAIQTYPAGATLCSADCCTELSEELGEIEERVENIEDCLMDGDITAYAYDETSDAAAVVLDHVGAPPFVRAGNVATTTLANNSSCKTRIFSCSLLTFSLFSITPNAQVEARMEISLDGGGSWVPLLTNRTTNTGAAGVVLTAYLNNERTYTVILLPGASQSISVRTRVELIAAELGGQADPSWFSDTVIIDALGVLR